MPAPRTPPPVEMDLHVGFVAAGMATTLLGPVLPALVAALGRQRRTDRARVHRAVPRHGLDERALVRARHPTWRRSGDARRVRPAGGRHWRAHRCTVGAGAGGHSLLRLRAGSRAADDQRPHRRRQPGTRGVGRQSRQRVMERGRSGVARLRRVSGRWPARRPAPRGARPLDGRDGHAPHAHGKTRRRRRVHAGLRPPLRAVSSVQADSYRRCSRMVGAGRPSSWPPSAPCSSSMRAWSRQSAAGWRNTCAGSRAPAPGGSGRSRRWCSGRRWRWAAFSRRSCFAGSPSRACSSPR